MNNPSMKLPRETPIYRRLRGYAFDPSLSLDFATADINHVIYKIRWEEELSQGERFGPGPVGEYIEVLDFDPTVGDKGTWYHPVDLNDPYILANDGLTPSESNPQFHQQFVYSVAMLTIQNFEKALGRQILWAPRLLEDSDKYEDYVPRLRLYPHALREANAYYSPLKKAILFGYFSASPASPDKQMPRSLVFSCLSHDIIAHEVTHAILDGLHRNYNRATNPDVVAFHEAFADIVALFQHFTFPEVLKHQIAKTRGELDKQNLLGELAREVGVAIGQYGSLRSAIGSVNKKTKQWEPTVPDPKDYRRTLEPHARGSILVAAVFEAFLTIYKGRIGDLLRIASGGTGILRQGELHPDLVNRLAHEASKTAAHVLTMCVRALDYCPPLDITFGDYLRAIITADYDVVKEDRYHYRLAFIDAFRRRGIYPDGIQTLSEESLRYRDEWQDLDSYTQAMLKIITDFLKGYRERILWKKDREEIYNITGEFISGKKYNITSESGRVEMPGLHEQLWQFLDNSYKFEKLTGLVFNDEWKQFGVYRHPGSTGKGPSYQILNLRLASRVGPDGNQINQIVFGLIQRTGVVYKKGKYESYIPRRGKAPPDGGFEVYGGCTLIFDLDSLTLKYAISKPLLQPEALVMKKPERLPNRERIERQHHFQTEEFPLLCMSRVGKYFGSGVDGYLDEPFSMLHQG